MHSIRIIPNHLQFSIPPFPILIPPLAQMTSKGSAAYDLNLLLGQDSEKITDHQLTACLSELTRLGYTNIGLNRKISQKYVPPAEIPLIALQSFPKMHFYSRITLELEDSSVNFGISSNPNILKYDLIAVVPKSEKAFASACSNLDVDLITLDLSESRLPFQLRANLIGEALRRGVRFEVNYAAALRDAGKRRNLFGNMTMLIRATRGKGIVLSSESSDPFEYRSAADICNMAFTLGLVGDLAFKSTKLNPKDALMNAANRKLTHKSTVSCLTEEAGEQSHLEQDFISFN